MGHTSVLLHESIQGLDIHSGDIFLDGTLGGAGHSEEVARRFGKSVTIIGIDADEAALERSQKRLEQAGANFTLLHGNFRNLDTLLDSIKIQKVNKILLDIGLSSHQIDESGRGFSFQKNEPLEMTFGKAAEGEVTAQTIVNEWSGETIATILKAYSEERFSYRIAQGIVDSRDMKPITTTQDLVDIILASTPRSHHHQRIHPATRTFQALRIAVNDELRALDEGIKKGFERLTPRGRMAVISFHSLEDRIVKHFFKEKAQSGEAIVHTKRPLVPGEDELTHNRRARSAKLRIIEKI